MQHDERKLVGVVHAVGEHPRLIQVREVGASHVVRCTFQAAAQVGGQVGWRGGHVDPAQAGVLVGPGHLAGLGKRDASGRNTQQAAEALAGGLGTQSAVAASRAISSRIFAEACFASCSKDAISDLLRCVVLDEVAPFGLGEPVESVAGCGSEGAFDIAEALAELGEVFIAEAECGTVALAAEGCHPQHFTATGSNVVGQRGEGAALGQGVVHQQVPLSGLDGAVELRGLEHARQAIHVRAVRARGLGNLQVGFHAHALGQHFGHGQRDLVAAGRLLGDDGQQHAALAAHELTHFLYEAVCHQVAGESKRGLGVTGLGLGIVRVVVDAGQGAADGGGGEVDRGGAFAVEPDVGVLRIELAIVSGGGFDLIRAANNIGYAAIPARGCGVAEDCAVRILIQHQLDGLIPIHV